MAKKPYRPKIIGNPLKKFKQPHTRPELSVEMHHYLERTMEEDHRAGLSLRAALFISETSNMPDPFFFKKARDLGYRIEDEWAFSHKHLKACFETADRIPKYVRDFEFHLLMHHSKEDLEKQFGSIEKFRAEMENQIRGEQSKGRMITFGINQGHRSNFKRNEFLGDQEMMSVRLSKT